jgi:hypothetical protein
MREIKFRVWTKTQDRYYYDYQIGKVHLDGTYSVPLNNIFKFNSSSLVFQQFTGLKDKNSREIYEGDLIQYNRRSSYDGITFEVKWSEDNWGWTLVSKNMDYLVNERAPEGYRYEFIEIVGNIFEGVKS